MPSCAFLLELVLGTFNSSYGSFVLFEVVVYGFSERTTAANAALWDCSVSYIMNFWFWLLNFGV